MCIVQQTQVNERSTNSIGTTSFEIPFLLQLIHEPTRRRPVWTSDRSHSLVSLCTSNIQPWRSNSPNKLDRHHFWSAYYSCCKQCPFPIPRPRLQTPWGFRCPQWCIENSKPPKTLPFMYSKRFAAAFRTRPPPNATTSSSSILPFCPNQSRI